jgi:hypothetical protein
MTNALTATALAYRQALEYHRDIEFFDVQMCSGTEQAAMVRIARFYLPCSDGSTLWLSASLGMTTKDANIKHHFVALGSSAEMLLPTLVAETFHFEQFLEPLGLDHTFPLGSASPLRSFGFTHALMITPTFGVREMATLAGPVHLLQVVPITASELDLKVRSGIDALLASWDEQEEDISLRDLASLAAEEES